MDGLPVSRDLLTDETLVGFFSPGCPACKEQLPKFVEFAAFPSVLKVAANDSGRPVVTAARVDLDRRPSPAV